MYQLNPFTRLISGLIVTEMHGLEIRCSTSSKFKHFRTLLHACLDVLTAEKEFSIFTPPSGQKCLEYAQNHINRVGGYINNPNATSACQYCSYAKGEDYYNVLGITFGDRWRDLGIFIAFIAFNAIVVRLLVISSTRLDHVSLLNRCLIFFPRRRSLHPSYSASQSGKSYMHVRDHFVLSFSPPFYN